ATTNKKSLWIGTNAISSSVIFMFSLLVLSLISAIIAIITIILTAPTTSATSTIENSTGLNLSVNISQVMSIRTLDSTATSDIASLNFAITPTPAGVRQTNTTVVDVATSNVSGYKLMMNSDYRTDGTSSDETSSADFTTSLINTDSTIAATEVGQISTSAGSSTASSTSYWNYSKSWNETLGPEGQTKSFSSTTLADTINPSTNQPYGTTILENLAIPAKATPDTVRDDVDIATSSSQTSISVNVNAATDKSSGIYKNELVFTAIANPIPVDYTLTFNKNTEDTVANLPDPLTATTMATSYTFTIPDTSGEGTLPAIEREGYNLVGWSTSATERQGSGSGPDGLYVAGDTYTVVADDSGNPDYTTHGTGNATLYAFWEEAFSCVANQICYNPNGADVVGEMENQTTVYMTSTTSGGSTDSTALSGSTTEFTLYSPNYSRTGYGFAGWNTKADGTGTMFGPNQTLTTSDSTLTSAMQSDLGSKGLIFHAIWVPSAGDLQTWTGCSSLTQGSVTALTDSRDSQTYAVAKLADDKCWMIENMRYKPTAGTETTSFSTSNPGDQQYSLTNIDRTLDPRAVSSQGSPYYQWYSYGGQYSWLSSINTTTNGSSNYSNWNTATSSYTTTGTTMAARTATDAVKNANICPAGWRLPRVAYNSYVDANAGSNSDFPYLQNALNSQYTYTSTFASSNNWRKYPNNFVFAGRWSGAYASDRGTRGDYWSSSVYNSSSAYYLYFYSTYVDPANYVSKSLGHSVRCVYSS
ncbi:hypothetical protein IKD60_02765, partial [Candidatus Saccharibacteria bacterium]|nr:hypothetical protein [Candidatus Saccharibacteria bacterium]